jgi:hypothetical protein
MPSGRANSLSPPTSAGASPGTIRLPALPPTVRHDHNTYIRSRSVAETRAQYVAQLLAGFPGESAGRPAADEGGSIER